ncbi:MAG: hypothetical protein LBQ82_02325 [Treponema sp.]|jgi:hypothetical protein|nr:hypothetical protein [Treponema sp.]
MDKEDRDTIKHISGTLDEILAFLKKPENRLLKVLEVGGAVASVLAVLGIIDIIIKWVIGG